MRHRWLSVVAIVGVALAHSPYVNPVQQGQQPLGYYRPPSARMMTAEEARNQQMNQMSQMQQKSSDAHHQASSSGVASNAPRLQQPVSPSAPSSQPKKLERSAKGQTMDSYLKSLGINDPEVEALLSETSVDEVVNSIDNAVQDAQHQHQHQQHHPQLDANPEDLDRPQSAQSLTSADVHINHAATAEHYHGNDDEFDEIFHQANTPNLATQRDQISSAVESSDTFSERDEAMQWPNQNMIDGIAEDDEPTYRLEQPEDPINDPPSHQLREPIEEWLEKFWEQRRTYKISSTQMQRHGQAADGGHLATAVQQQGYGHPSRPQQQGQSGSQINVYGQLHIHVGNQRTR